MVETESALFTAVLVRASPGTHILRSTVISTDNVWASESPGWSAVIAEDLRLIPLVLPGGPHIMKASLGTVKTRYNHMGCRFPLKA